MIIIVGHKPSSLNINKDIAFVGTPSYKTLLNWIADMKLDVNEVLLCNINHFFEYFNGEFGVETPNLTTDIHPEDGDKILVLGREAEKFIKTTPYKYFYLPHPSGRNRVLNNKSEVKKILTKCRKWLENE